MAKHSILLVHPYLQDLNYYREILQEDYYFAGKLSIYHSMDLTGALTQTEMKLPQFIFIHQVMGDRWGVELLRRILNLNRRFLRSTKAIILLLCSEDEESQQEVLNLVNASIYLDYWIYPPKTQRIASSIFRSRFRVLHSTLIFDFNALQENEDLPSEPLPQFDGIAPEKILEERTAEFEAFLQSIPDAVLLITIDHRVKIVNNAFTLLFGYFPGEIIGRSSSFLYKNPLDFYRMSNLYFHPDRHSYSQPYEVPYLHKLGFELHAETVAAPVRDSRGVLVGYISIIRDLFDRRKTELALVESEERFRQLVNHMEDIFWMVDIESEIIIYVSPSYDQVFGYPHQDLLFKTFDQWVEKTDQTDQDVSAQIFTASQNQRVEWEYRIRRADGELRWIRERIFPVFNAQGQIYRLAGLAEDISDRKRRDEELIHDRNLREAIFNEATDALFLVDPQSSLIVDCNQSAVHLFEANEKSELIGIHGVILQKNPFNQEEIESIQAQIKEKSYWTAEVEYITLQGRLFWGNIASRPIEIMDKRIHLVRVTDITAQKKVKQELENALLRTEELSTLKSQFIAMASHEFRTPLTIIGSSASILKNFGDRLSSESRLEHLNTIQNYVKHANRLVADVLLLSQDNTRGLQFSPVNVNIYEFTQDTLRSLKLTHNRIIDFTYLNSTDDNNSYVDPQLLQQILINLISNALKYSPLETPIWVKLILSETTQLFEVRDSGIGIPDAAQDQLFDSFYRAENVGVITGTGLGLNIVKRCVELHKGEISFVSELNQGTTFTVVLPRYATTR